MNHLLPALLAPLSWNSNLSNLHPDPTRHHDCHNFQALHLHHCLRGGKNKTTIIKITLPKHVLSNGEVLFGSLNRTRPAPQISCSRSHPCLTTTMTPVFCLQNYAIWGKQTNKTQTTNNTHRHKSIHIHYSHTHVN